MLPSGEIKCINFELRTGTGQASYMLSTSMKN